MADVGPGAGAEVAGDRWMRLDASGQPVVWLTWNRRQLLGMCFGQLLALPVFIVIVCLATRSLAGLFFLLGVPLFGAVGTANYFIMRRYGVELSPWGVRIVSRGNFGSGNRTASWDEIGRIESTWQGIRFDTLRFRTFTGAPRAGRMGLTFRDPDFDEKLATLLDWWTWYRNPAWQPPPEGWRPPGTIGIFGL